MPEGDPGQGGEQHSEVNYNVTWILAPLCKRERKNDKFK
jgi:hypothetical protein